MTTSSIGRREFLRRAGLTAGTVGLAGGAASLAGCGSKSVTGPTPPAAPTSLVAAAQSAARIDLTWSDNADDETSYEVERRRAADIAFTPLSTLASDVTGYVDDSVAEQTLYVYRVRAVAEGLASEFSNEAESTTPAAGTPLAPLNAAVESVSADGAVITWADAAVNETGYRIERIDDAGSVTLLLPPRDAVRAELAGLGADELVRVRVIAFNELGDSPPSAEIRFFTGSVAEALQFQIPAPGTLRIRWTDRTGGRLGFRVERNAGSGFEPLATLPAGAASFDDAAPPLGATVVYRVAAADAASLEPPTAAQDTPAAPPAMPSAVVLTHVATNGARLQLDWQHPGEPSLLGFFIDRRIGTGAETRLAPGADAAARTLEDAPNAPFVPVLYRVSAWNLAGISAPSADGTITPRAVFPLTGTLAVLNTVNKGVAVTINRPSVSVGASCNATTTSVYLVRDSVSTIAAVVAHCTHECLRPPNFRWVENALPTPRFRCAHGSEFDLAGTVLHGPASRNVATLQSLLFTDRVELVAPAIAP